MRTKRALALLGAFAMLALVVPVASAAPGDPGEPLPLSGVAVADREVDEARLTPDGSRVVFTMDDAEDNRHELFSAPVNGGPPVKLSGDRVAGSDVTDFEISPDSSTGRLPGRSGGRRRGAPLLGSGRRRSPGWSEWSARGGGRRSGRLRDQSGFDARRLPGRRRREQRGPGLLGGYRRGHSGRAQLAPRRRGGRHRAGVDHPGLLDGAAARRSHPRWTATRSTACPSTVASSSRSTVPWSPAATSRTWC